MLNSNERLPATSSPRIFLSYTHDSPAHRIRVRALADRLHRDGVEASLDQYVEPPLEGWSAWTQQELDNADIVLVVCTETYNRRNQGAEAVEEARGASWEEALFVEALSRPGWIDKLVPIIFEASDAEHIPAQLRAKSWFEVQSEEGYAALLRLLTDRSVRVGTTAPPPTPVFDNEETQLLAGDLEAAYRRYEHLMLDGSDTAATLEGILDLKRRMRESGRLKAGDYLLEGRFRLLELLGEGGFATVWKGWDRKRGDLVAIKVLHSQYAQDRSRRERFFRGARIMGELQHHGIVRVFVNSGEDSGYYFFVMEYMGGGDLRRAVLQGRLSGAEALNVVRQVGEAVAFAHAHGAMHRDIKPANILLTESRCPKLTDFDLVRGFDTTGGTRTGSMLGTFLYMAPESMMDAKEVDARADIYSFAMTVAFVLHGAELPMTILREWAGFLARLKCSNEVRSALEKATALNPGERFVSVEEFLEALGASSAASPPRELAALVAPPELLAFRRSVPWAETLLASLRRDDVGVSLCEEDVNDCWHLLLRLPESFRDLYGLAPQVLLLAASNEVQGGDLQRARARLYRNRFELDLDLMLVVDGEPALAQRVRRISYGEEPWVPWELIKSEFAPLDRILPIHLPGNDIFRRKDPVTGLQFVGREALITELSKALKAGRAVGVFGLRKSGKTSVVRAVTDRLDPESSLRLHPAQDRKTPRPSVASLLVTWLDCQSAMERELEPLAERLVRALAQRLEVEDPALTARLAPVGSAMDRLDSLLRHALDRTRIPICLVLDEYDWLFAGGGSAPPITGLDKLFGLLRAHAQATGRLVLAVIGRDPQSLDLPRMGGRSNPVLQWFERYWLGPMSKKDADQLLVGLGRRVLLDVQPATADLARFWTGGFPLLHRKFGSALLKLSRATREGPHSIPTDPFREQAVELFLDDDESMNSCREVFDLLTERHPEAADLLRTLGSNFHGLDGTRWQQPAARTLRRLGLLDGTPEVPVVPELYRWYVRTFAPGLQERWAEAQ